MRELAEERNQMKKKPTPNKEKKPQVKVQDLKPKKDAKGGGLWQNHNESFVSLRTGVCFPSS